MIEATSAQVPTGWKKRRRGSVAASLDKRAVCRCGTTSTRAVIAGKRQEPSGLCRRCNGNGSRSSARPPVAPASIRKPAPPLFSRSSGLSMTGRGRPAFRLYFGVAPSPGRPVDPVEPDAVQIRSTSHRPAPPGSTRSNASSRCSPQSSCSAASTGPPPNSSRPSSTTSKPSARTSSPSAGTSQPTTSSLRSGASASEPSKPDKSRTSKRTKESGHQGGDCHGCNPRRIC